MTETANTLVKLTLIYLMLMLGYTFTRGFYSQGSFLVILATFIFLLFLKSSKSSHRLPTDIFLFLVLEVSLILSLIFYGGLYQNNELLIITSRILTFVTIPLSWLYLVNKTRAGEFWQKYKYGLLITIALILRIMMIISSPHPKIDIFDQLKMGSAGLWQLKNPYQMTFPVIYKNQHPIIAGYPPGAFVFLAPFTLLFKDPRVAMVLADMGSAIILYLLLKRTQAITAQVISLIFLFNPRSLYVIEQSWLDPLITFFVYLFVYYYLKKKRSLLPLIILGIGITIKQTLFLIIPAIFFKLRWRLPQWIVLASVIGVIVIPFILWSPYDFFFDQTAGFNPLYNTAPVKASLNFVGFFYNSLGFDLPKIRFISFTLLLIYIFQKSQKTFNGFLLCFTLTTFASILFYQQAFLNYFTFLNSLILLFLTVVLKRTNSDPNGQAV